MTADQTSLPGVRDARGIGLGGGSWRIVDAVARRYPVTDPRQRAVSGSQAGTRRDPSMSDAEPSIDPVAATRSLLRVREAEICYKSAMPALKLGPEVLARAGFTNLTRDQVEECLKDIYQTLELRVGEQMARKLNKLQLSQFEQLIDENREHAQGLWLEKNVPDYREIVSQELQLIEERLTAAASASSRQKIREKQIGAESNQN
ncbi:MAG: hypothetical protein HZB45_16685 [Mycolicibacterium rufum]|nr:hypothetical protein [Mycolicibacterium rufum]